MASPPNHILSTEALAKWERLYHLLGRGYGYITQNPDTEAEILSLFARMDTAFIEGTALEREYETFPTFFINFLKAYQDAHPTIILARIVKARYHDQLECLELAESVAANRKKAIKSAHEQVSLLVREREKLIERLASTTTYFEHDPSDIVMKFRCDWLEIRLQDITMEIAVERELVRNLELAAEHQETSIARFKEKCTHFFFKLASLESQKVRCRHIINCSENQLNSFVMLIRAQFGFTFPPQ